MPNTLTPPVSHETSSGPLISLICEKSHIIVFLCAVSLCFSITLACDLVWDNDIYFIIATGRDILQNGFSTIEPLTLHEGLSYSTQQWLSCVVTALIYEVGGRGAVSLFHLAVAFVASLVLWYASYLASGRRKTLSAFIAGSMVLLSIGFLKTNPRVYDLLFMGLSWLLTYRFLQTKKPWPLVANVCCAIIFANLHASMWPLMIVAPSAAMFAPGLSRSDRLQTVVCCAGTVFAALCTPFGTDSLSYVFASLASESFSAYDIQELAALEPGNFRWFALMIVSALYVAFRIRQGRLNLFYDLVFAFGFLMATSTIRSWLIFLIYGSIGLCYALGPVRNLSKTLVRPPLYASCCIMLAVVAAMFAGLGYPNMGFGQEETDPDRIAREAAVKAMGEVVPIGSDVFCGLNDGGYLEFKGYRPFIDARAEVFVPEINKKEDIAQEWREFSRGYTEFSELDSKYRFDAALVEVVEEGEGPIWLERTFEEAGYEKIYDEGGYAVFVPSLT